MLAGVSASCHTPHVTCHEDDDDDEECVMSMS